MTQNRHIHTLFIGLITLLLSTVCAGREASAQSATHIDGVVLDSVTGESLPFVTITYEENKKIGSTSDVNGKFSVTSTKGYRHLIFSFVGYETKHVILKPGEKRHAFRVRMNVQSVTLGALIVRPKKQKYSRKNNPAVELMKKAIALKKYNHINAVDRYQYDTYERLVISLDNFRKGDSFFGIDSAKCATIVDTSAFGEKLVFPVSLREKVSHVVKNEVDGEMTRVVGQNLIGIEEEVDEGPLSANIQEIFRPVDIYDANIPILLQRIPSPLNKTFATGFYKFFIQDTVMIDGIKCIELNFVPFEPHAPGFTGKIRLTQPECAVQHVELNMPYSSNINWVKKMKLIQNFKSHTIQEGDSTRVIWLPDKQITDVLITADQLFINRGLEIQQTRIFTDYIFGQDAKTMPLNLKEKPEGYINIIQDQSKWQAVRPEKLPHGAASVPILMDHLKKRSLYKTLSFVARSVISGYIPVPKGMKDGYARSKFDLGPIQTFLSGNSIEGFRVRIGGETTANLSPHFFWDGYLAYGTKDNKLKYRSAFYYSPNRKQYFIDEFPRKNIYASIQYDLFTPGQIYEPIYNGDIIRELGSMDNRKRTYINEYKLGYIRDWTKTFSTDIFIGHKKVTPTNELIYEEIMPDMTTQRVSFYKASEVGISLQWEPLRVIYNGRKGTESGFNLTRRGPLFKLSHRWGIKGFLGSSYNYQRTDFEMRQDLRLSLFGYIDLRGTAGIIWDKAPYPLLEIPATNGGYFINQDCYQLMKPQEFIMDRWVGLHAYYHMNGLLFDRIPLLKKLGLREVISYSFLWGNMSNKNLPTSPGLYKYSEGVEAMSNTWYMEGSIGIENIFKLFRVDLFRRFTQLHKPDVDKWGLRVAVSLHF